MTEVRIRPAGPADAAVILAFIRELAEYEREPQAVVATEDVLRAQLESPAPPFECVLAEIDGRPVGFALFVPSYSTWLGRPGIHLEDLYVRPAARNRGVGRRLMVHLAQLAVARGCGRLEWSVLDWNAPALAFYARLGAEPKRGWIDLRLEGDALLRCAGRTAGDAAG